MKYLLQKIIAGLNHPLFHVSLISFVGFAVIFGCMIFLSPPGFGIFCGTVFLTILFLAYGYAGRGKLGTRVQAIIICSMGFCIMTAVGSLLHFADWPFSAKNEGAFPAYSTGIIVASLLVAYLVARRVREQPLIMALVTVFFIIAVYSIFSSAYHLPLSFTVFNSSIILSFPFFWKRHELPPLPKLLVLEVLAFAPYLMGHDGLAGYLLFFLNSLYLMRAFKTFQLHRQNAVSLFFIIIGLNLLMHQYPELPLQGNVVLVVIIFVMGLMAIYMARHFNDIPLIDYSLLSLTVFIVTVVILPDKLLQWTNHSAIIISIVLLFVMGALALKVLRGIRQRYPFSEFFKSARSLSVTDRFIHGTCIIILVWCTFVFFRTIIQADCNNDSPTSIMAQQMDGPFRISESMFIKLAMKDAYLWQDQVNVFGASSSDPDTLIEQLRYQRYDRGWSSVVLKKDDENKRIKGKYTGLGLYTMIIDQRAYIGFVHSGSSAAKAGIKRGFELVAIDHNTFEENSKLKRWEKIGEDLDNGRAVHHRFIDNQGKILDVDLKEGLFRREKSFGHILERDGKKIGYLHYLSFNDWDNEFLAIINNFHKEGISDLILDLRYNSGGESKVAMRLASRIAGRATEGKVFLRYVYSNRYQNKNEDLLFEEAHPALNLKRLVVLTTEETASASELLINGLRPYMPVITIGERTYGKPVGQDFVYYSDKIIQFVSYYCLNANGDGYFFNGIPPTYQAQDDLRHPLGSPEEAMTKAALCYLNTGMFCK